MKKKAFSFLNEFKTFRWMNEPWSLCGTKFGEVKISIKNLQKKYFGELLIFNYFNVFRGFS